MNDVHRVQMADSTCELVDVFSHFFLWQCAMRDNVIQHLQVLC